MNSTGKIAVVGLGPGNIGDVTRSAIDALKQSQVIIGYKLYLTLIDELKEKGIVDSSVEIIPSGMKEEVSRALMAIDYASDGKSVAIVSSGDAGIYGMAPLIFELLKERDLEVEVTVFPGISAFQKASALLGAPVGHDFCVISLSDLMTPWQKIEKRIEAAAKADFVTAVYNPKSHGRYWQLHRLKEIFSMERNPHTPVGYVRNAGREDQTVKVTTLSEFDPEDIDMFTVIIIGNSQTFEYQGKIITPRGYSTKADVPDNLKSGQNIMIQSFRTIDSMLTDRNIDVGVKWTLLHVIHTTADFEMEKLLKIDSGAVEKIYNDIISGKTSTIVTDVTMVAAGIRKGALERLGIEVKCFINDPDVIEESKKKGITRAQAAMRKAVELYPDALYAIGNAPTALLELCSLTKKAKAQPSGIIAAPVGFVNVLESKHAVKALAHIPKIIVEGRKGGSNIAATITNSILCWNDAQQLKPGRDV